MRPLLHPSLVNGPFGDPALYIETMFDRRAILFDLGDISALPPRKILRLERVFVSHAHIDHFVGFDRLLRLLVGRERTINLYGPKGFIDNVDHKLHAYRWNLVDRFLCDLTFPVTEIDASYKSRTVRFRLRSGFAREEIGPGCAAEGLVYSEPTFHVRATILEHRTPCLAFALEESAHINIWRNRLLDMGLPVGPWLKDLKRAVTENRPDDYMIRVGSNDGRIMRLNDLRAVLTVTPGQKIGYVTDAADTKANRSAIAALVRNADLLFIEAAFAEADTALADERAHLTTVAAGQIAREAGVRRVEPFHFSPRYEGQGERLRNEVMAAFGGEL